MYTATVQRSQVSTNNDPKRVIVLIWIITFQSKKNVKEVNMSIVGEVIEKLMGDSYHSLYLRDPRYLASVPEKSRKNSQDILVLGR